MKKILYLVLAGTLAVSCGNQKNGDAADEKSTPGAQIQPSAGTRTAETNGPGFISGGPAYTLAQSLAEKVPELNPEKNAVIVQTSEFGLTTADLMQNLVRNLGKRQEQFSRASAEEIRQNLKKHAERLAVQKLFLARAVSAGYSADAEELERAMADIYRRYGSKEKYTDIMNNYGVPLEFVREDTKKSVIINKYLDSIPSIQKTDPSQRQQAVAAYVSTIKEKTGFRFTVW